MTRRLRQVAFTLIELLVVIAIISLLVSILLPSLNRARVLAKRAVCGVQMRHLGIALTMLADDNEGKWPDRWDNPSDTSGPHWGSFRPQLFEYVGHAKAVYCPSSGNQDNEIFIERCYDPSYEYAQWGCDYSMFVNSHQLSWPNPIQPRNIMRIDDVADSARQVLAADNVQGHYSLSGWEPGKPHVGNHEGYAPPVEGANRAHFDAHVEWHGRDELVIGARGGAADWLWFW